MEDNLIEILNEIGLTDGIKKGKLDSNEFKMRFDEFPREIYGGRRGSLENRILKAK